MAIHKYARAVLRALSYPADIDVKKHYLLVRGATRLIHPPLPPLKYKTFPFKVRSGDHVVPCRLFAPQGADPADHLPVILFAHGGGWIAGDVGVYSRACQSLATETNHRVIAMEYRLAPEYPFPAGLEDYYAVARALFLDPILSVPPEQMTLMGDSAGGNLTAALSLLARDRGEFTPPRQILIYPACAPSHDPETSPYASLRENAEGYLLTTRRVREYMAMYCADPDARRNPYFAPLAADDLSDQPDTLVITAQYDPLRDEGAAYARALKRAGNRVFLHCVPDALHGFFNLSSRFSQVQECYAHIRAFLNEVEL